MSTKATLVPSFFSLGGGESAHLFYNTEAQATYVDLLTRWTGGDTALEDYYVEWRDGEVVRKEAKTGPAAPAPERRAGGRRGNILALFREVEIVKCGLFSVVAIDNVGIISRDLQRDLYSFPCLFKPYLLA